MIDPLLVRAVSLAFALLLIAAAWHKFASWHGFVAALEDYRLLPGGLLRPAARLIPACEAALALAWLAGYRPGATALATATLLGVYATAIAVNLRRGRVHIGCGCGFGAAGRDPPLSWWLVGRNLLLGCVALLAAVPAAGRELGRYDALTLVAALVAAVLLYAGASELLRNGAAMAAWRKPRG